MGLTWCRGLQQALAPSKQMSPAAVAGDLSGHVLPVLPSQRALEGFLRKLEPGCHCQRDSLGKEDLSLSMDDFCFAEPKALLSSSHLKMQSAGFLLAAINWFSHHFPPAVADLCQ